MRVLIVGGYGLIGGYVLARLAADGHELIGIGRDTVEARRRFPAVRWITVDLATANTSAWDEALQGVEAVVNCAGALQDSRRDDLRAVHVDGLGVLARAAAAAGVRRMIHISAAGVEVSPGAFGATKRAAEAMLAAIDLSWIVLRPGLVLASNAFGGSALLRGLAAFPFVIPAIHADRPVQVVSARDVAAAVAAALKSAAPTGVAIDLVADEETSLADILRALRGWLGYAPAPIVRAPLVLARLSAAIADALAHLGWRSPLRTTAVDQLAAGVQGDAGSAQRLLGVKVRGLSEILTDDPAGIQERWFARLYLLKPAILVMLAAFWCASGLIGLAQQDRAAAVLTQAGFSHAAAEVLVLSGVVIDLLLGALLCHRRSARLALFSMLAVSAGYLVGASLWRPDLWIDPMGALVKVLPGAMLACVALAILPER
jgi:uncharacterized protein YbjT (DUF2867 family)